MVELIPKKEQKPIFGQIFFLIVSLCALLAVAIAFFVFRQLVENEREVLGVLEKRFLEDTRPLEEELAMQLQSARKKTEILGTVLDERKNALVFFRLLEQTTHPGVVFQKLEGNVKTGIFVLGGEAQDFVVLEQQRLVWEAQEGFSAILRDIQLSDEGKSSFEVEFVVKPEVLDSI